MLRKALSGILFLILAFNYFHFILPGRSYADINQDRSIIISTGVPSAVATHLFKFSEATTNNIGSIVF